GEALPAVRAIVGGGAGLFDGADMRAGLCLGLADAPERAEGGVRQANTAIGTEDRDAFRQVIDGLVLDLDQRVVARLEVDLLRQVLEGPAGAALRAGRGEDAHRLAVRQVPGLGLRVDGAINGKRGFLPLFPIVRLRQL